MAVSDVVEVRVPPDVQEAAGRVIQEAGLTVGDVVRVVISRIAQDQAIPMEIFHPSAATLEAFQEVEHGALKHFASVDALFDDLHADD